MKDTNKGPEWITGWQPGMSGVFPVISTRLSFKDRLGGFRVRWAMGRMSYRVYPGLYAVGKPDADAPVLVTANYKLTFDSLRKHLEGINAWILVLDTKGVNVWCAAGKGTFGTEELIRRVKAVNLSLVVRHRRLILPQLGAPGVAAHVVTAKTGFKVTYGPIRAADLPRFLENGLRADPGMRIVSFTLLERLVVAPVQLVQAWKIALAALIFHVISQYPQGNIISWSMILGFLPYMGTILVGCLLVPALLPWIPGASLAFKGWLAGAFATIIYTVFHGYQSPETIVYLLVLPAVSSYLALNFTGATPYTSLSGVKKEMRFALPLLTFSAVLGIVLNFVY